jgi:hypothetical protein
MSEFLSETEGCDLLARLFKARGYAIARNLLFREYGVEFHIDGWDAKARVGFEFLSSEDDDHDDLTVFEYQTLAAAQQRGELALFIIDEVEPLSAADLALSANEFLDEMADAERSLVAGRKKTPAKNSSAKKKPAARKAPSSARSAVIKKTSAGGGVGTKNVAGKAKKAVVKAVVGKKGAVKKTVKKTVLKKGSGTKKGAGIAKAQVGRKTGKKKSRTAR